MRLTFNILSFVTLAGCCLIVLADSSVAQQIKGVKIEAKRSADLPEDPFSSGRSTSVIDIDKVKEFDRISGVCSADHGTDMPPAVVANASIELYRKTRGRDGRPNIDELVAATKTGDDGTFAFENLQAEFPTDKFDKYFILVAAKEGYATNFLSSLGWDTDQQNIKLSKRAMVKGSIKNDVGNLSRTHWFRSTIHSKNHFPMYMRPRLTKKAGFKSTTFIPLIPPRTNHVRTTPEAQALSADRRASRLRPSCVDDRADPQYFHCNHQSRSQIFGTDCQ